MFDLFRSREKSVRYILGGILLLVAAAMIITMVPGYGTGVGMDRSSDVIAKIGDQELTGFEVRNALQREMRSRQLPPQMAEMYIPVFVQQMISERATAYMAKDLGFQVTDNELSDAIQGLIPGLYQDGKFVGREAYSNYLAQMNLSIPQFESDVRQQILMTRLETMALEGIIVTPGEVETEFRRKNEKMKVSYFALTPEQFRGKVQVTPAALQEYWNRSKAAFRIPEKRNYVLFLVDEAKVAAAMPVQEAELRKMYDARRESFRMPERVKVRHILLKTTDKSPEEVKKIQQRMEDLLKQAKSGDFAALATKNSEDAGSAQKGGDLDWLVKGQTVPEFEKTAFGLKPGEVSGIVKTQYGLHILKLDAKEDARLRPFEEVRAELANEVNSQLASTKVQQLTDQIRTALVRSEAEAEKLAQANGIAVVRVEKAGEGDPIQEIGVSPDFQEGVSKLAKGGVSTAIPLPNGRMVVAKVTDILPARPAEFNEVEAQVKNQYLTEQTQKLYQEAVAGLKSKMASAGGNLAALAKEYGAEIKTSTVFSRDGAVEGLGPATAVEEGFSKNVGDMFGPISLNSQTAVLKVDEKVPADLTQLAAQRATLLQNLKTQRARERRDLMWDGIVKKLIAEKKIKVNEDAIKRLTASYRG